MKGKELDPTLVDLFLNSQTFIIKEDEQHNGDEILSEIQNKVNTLILNGDFSIAGMNDQLSILVQLLAEGGDAASGICNPSLPFEIDLHEAQDLDACGCQLLVLLFRNLRHRGIETISLKLGDEYREKIHLFGFASEIFTEERV